MNKTGDIELAEREKAILETLIQLYILRASPIGSKLLSKNLAGDMELSSASVRNVMAKLEEAELISHPHTSAGRIPTDKGYRFYVDSLVKVEGLTDSEMRAVTENIKAASANVLRDASKVLGRLSKHLSIVVIPQIKDLIVERIEIVSLSATRFLVIVILDSNNVRTVTLEAEFDIDNAHLAEICSYINEKVSGRPLKFLREKFSEVIGDFEYKDMPLVRLFVESVDKIFERHVQEDKLLIAGTKNLLEYPEFEDPGRFRSVIEIIEDEDIIIHLLDKMEKNENGINVFIGSEMQNDSLQDYSLVISSYKYSSATGNIGLIGPKRMDYSRMISLVELVSGTLSEYY